MLLNNLSDKTTKIMKKQDETEEENDDDDHFKRRKTTANTSYSFTCRVQLIFHLLMGILIIFILHIQTSSASMDPKLGAGEPEIN